MTGPGVVVAVSLAVILACRTPSRAQEAGADADRGDRIGLADLADYRAALSGRPTADEARPSDPPDRIGFCDLWERPESYRGRRVTIGGRIERTFRQGAVGSFPPLVESWIFSPRGDPICVVYPRPEASGGIEEPGPGRMARFTGTFLKTVRYAGGDGERMAPLIVGDRPPEASIDGGEPAATARRRDGISGVVAGRDHDPRVAAERRSWASGNVAMGVCLALIAALVIAGQHLRGAVLRHSVNRRRPPRDSDLPDPPLHFVDSPEES